MISCKDLRFSYTTDGESIVGLDGLSLKIVAGEYVAIMGPNGSGKSTLARVISGIMPQDEGEYFFDGVSAKSPDGSRLIMENIGIVFQNPDNQMVAMTVESEIAFPLENKNISPSIIREKVNQIVEIFGLKELLKRPPQMLSGGERQKVLIASVLTCEPICLIFDEPTPGVDPTGQIEVRQIILNLAQRGKTIFLSSHNLDEVQRICNRIALIDQGEIKLYGELEKLRRDMGRREVIIETGITTTEEARLLDGLVAELEALPYVTSCCKEAQKLRLQLDGRGDVSEIVAMLSQKSIGVEEVRKGEISLEEIYAKVTKGGE